MTITCERCKQLMGQIMALTLELANVRGGLEVCAQEFEAMRAERDRYKLELELEQEAEPSE